MVGDLEIMRLDHLAYRVAQGKRDEAAKFFIDAFGYKFQDEFEIYFNDEKTEKALCVALEPPEKISMFSLSPSWGWVGRLVHSRGDGTTERIDIQYHMAPEVFISEGTEGSIVANWVKSRNGVGGVHHLAYQVSDVKKTMEEWKRKGWASFTSENPMKCPGLTQVFTRENMLGTVFEFICREGQGFCKDNVKALMQSTLGD